MITILSVTLIFSNVLTCACWYFIGKNLAELNHLKQEREAYEEFMNDLEDAGWIVELEKEKEEE